MCNPVRRNCRLLGSLPAIRAEPTPSTSSRPSHRLGAEVVEPPTSVPSQNPHFVLKHQTYESWEPFQNSIVNQIF